MASRRAFVRYWTTTVIATFGGCTTGTPKSTTGTTPIEETTETTSDAETTDTTSTETTTCGTPTTVASGGTGVSVANWRSIGERLSVSVYRLIDGERERLFSKTYPLSDGGRTRSEDVITDSGRYRIEASTADGASASFETPIPDENDAALNNYSIDVIVTESGNVEIGLSIRDVGTPSSFGDDC